MGVISEYYQSGVDSFFLFPASQAEGYIVTSIKAAAPAESYVKALLATEQAIPEGIIAPFLGNHDTGRTVGLLQARAPTRTRPSSPRAYKKYAILQLDMRSDGDL